MFARLYSTPTGVETPDVIDLRKQQRKEPEKPLYQVIALYVAFYFLNSNRRMFSPCQKTHDHPLVSSGPWRERRKDCCRNSSWHNSYVSTCLNFCRSCIRHLFFFSLHTDSFLLWLYRYVINTGTQDKTAAKRVILLVCCIDMLLSVVVFMNCWMQKAMTHYDCSVVILHVKFIRGLNRFHPIYGVVGTPVMSYIIVVFMCS